MREGPNSNGGLLAFIATSLRIFFFGMVIL
jgi:hypothetical protein